MKSRLLCSIALVTAGLTAMATAGHATTLRLACPSAATNPTCLTAQRFADDAAKNSGGSLDIQVFPAGQLGKGKEAIQQMQAGIIDMVVEDISNYGNFLPDYNIVSWGFTFRDQEHFLTFLDSELHQEMVDALREEQGIELLAAKWRKLPRVVVSKTPVRTPEDLRGLKFRVPAIPAYIAAWETLGANPTQVPWAESFQALKTGIVDAMEAPYDSVLSQKFHLAAPYVTLTNHVFASMTLAMSAARYDALSDDEKQAIADAAETATAYSQELAAKSAAQVADQIVKDGGQVIEVDAAPFAEKLRDAVAEQEAEGLWSEGLYQAIQSLD